MGLDNIPRESPKARVENSSPLLQTEKMQRKLKKQNQKPAPKEGREECWCEISVRCCGLCSLSFLSGSPSNSEVASVLTRVTC